MGGWTRSYQVALAMHALVVRRIRAVRDFRIVGSPQLCPAPAIHLKLKVITIDSEFRPGASYFFAISCRFLFLFRPEFLLA